MNEWAILKTEIESIIALNEEEWLLASKCFKPRKLDKNEFLLEEGQICEEIAFIQKGLLIYFKILDNGDDKTTDFAFEGEWVTDNHSRLNNSPSMLNIKAIEETELLVIKQKDLEKLYIEIPKLERLGRILIEQAFTKLVDLSMDLQILSAKERYIKLLENHPEVIQKIPQYHIANYLGVAPKSLSRIRNTIFK